MNNNFNKRKFSSGGRPESFSRGPARPKFGPASRRPAGRDFNNSETFKATCAKCQNICEVPFKPNGKKPVYCQNCFVRDEARPDGGSSSYERRPYNTSAPERSFVPTRPAAEKDPRIDAMQKELAAISAKLDLLIRNNESAAFASIIESSKARKEAPEKAAKPAKKVAAVKKSSKKLQK